MGRSEKQDSTNEITFYSGWCFILRFSRHCKKNAWATKPRPIAVIGLHMWWKRYNGEVWAWWVTKFAGLVDPLGRSHSRHSLSVRPSQRFIVMRELLPAGTVGWQSGSLTTSVLLLLLLIKTDCLSFLSSCQKYLSAQNIVIRAKRNQFTKSSYYLARKMFFNCLFSKFQNKTCVSSMIHSARPTVQSVAITIFTWNLFCFARFYKVGTGGQTHKKIR